MYKVYMKYKIISLQSSTKIIRRACICCRLYEIMADIERKCDKVEIKYFQVIFGGKK